MSCEDCAEKIEAAHLKGYLEGAREFSMPEGLRKRLAELVEIMEKHTPSKEI